MSDSEYLPSFKTIGTVKLRIRGVSRLKPLELLVCKECGGTRIAHLGEDQLPLGKFVAPGYCLDCYGDAEYPVYDSK